MQRIENRHRDGRHILNELLAATMQTCMRSSRLRRKVERLLDRKRREMNIVLRAVLYVSTVVFVNFLRSERVVHHVSVNCMEIAALVGKHTQERAAACARASKDNCRGAA